MDANTQRLMMGAAGVSGAATTYVEDVFSTWLYTGNGSTQTITNGIDLAGKGGLVWIKGRTDVGGTSAWGGNIDHALFDTARGMDRNSFSRVLSSNRTDGQAQLGTGGAGALSTGFDLGYNGYDDINFSGNTYASWTFRKAAKFFDVVTYAGTGSATTVAHNLGSVPGCIIVKRTDAANDWQVYHRSLNATEYLVLNTAAGRVTGTTRWNSTAPTSTEFSLGTDATVNASGGTYVAYLFAHNAGGFGDAGTSDVISCGTYTGNGSATGPTVTLGWEPQWLLVKQSTAASGTSWNVIDSMRGIPLGGVLAPRLQPSSANAENTNDAVDLLPDGFQIKSTAASINGSGNTYIYIAIRRGPMKTPTDATKVFQAIARAGTSATATVSAGFSTDMALIALRSSCNPVAFDRLRGATRYSNTTNTLAETTDAATLTGFDSNSGVVLGADAASGYVNSSGNYINWFFRRAPGFFDVVAYTGNGGSQTISHNLAAIPEIILVKKRNSISNWTIELRTSGVTARGSLDLPNAISNSNLLTSVTSSSFTSSLGYSIYNASGDTYIAYLFASCPGVSKVGSYTGTGTTLQVNCGFTNGARFVLIKRTDSTGDWYVWDTARGIISGNDSYLLLNSTAAEVTNTDYIDPYSAGFEISGTAPAAINANGGSFVYLAVA